MRDSYTNTPNSSATQKSQKDHSCSDATIMRSPHDQRNPYVVLNKNLINDMTISPDCCRLLIWLLAKPDDWMVKTSNIKNEFQNWWGIKKIWKLLNEAIDAGYMKREIILKGGRRIDCVYYVSESPIYREYSKKDARNSLFGSSQFGSDILSNKSTTNIQRHKEESAPPPPSKIQKQNQEQERPPDKPKQPDVTYLKPMITTGHVPSPGRPEMVAETKEFLSRPLECGTKRYVIADKDKEWFYGFSPKVLEVAATRIHLRSKKGDKISKYTVMLFSECAKVRSEY